MNCERQYSPDFWYNYYPDSIKKLSLPPMTKKLSIKAHKFKCKTRFGGQADVHEC